MQVKNITTADTARFELDNPAHILNQLSEKIRESAFKIHRTLGPGLMEKCYQECLHYDLTQNWKLQVDKERYLPIRFESLLIPNAYRIDLIVENLIVLEIKSHTEILPIHRAQLLNYMKLGHFRLGYLINFNHRLLKDGIQRLVL